MGFLGGGGATGTPTETPNPVNDSTTVDSVRSDAVAAMADVDAYVVDSTVDEEYESEVNPSVGINTTTRVNRTSRRINLTQVYSSTQRTYTVGAYALDGTMYGYSDFYRAEYGGEWIRYVPSDFERSFERRDTLSRQRSVLEGGNVTLAGTQTVRGTETYVVDANVSDEQYRSLVASYAGNATRSNVTVESASYRLWIANDTHLPVKSTATLELTVLETNPNTSVRTTATLRYEYGTTVNVTLPEEASNAENVTDELGGRSAPSLRKSTTRQSARQQPHSLARSRSGPRRPPPTDTDYCD
jgi:hypothetical protein